MTTKKRKPGRPKLSKSKAASDLLRIRVSPDQKRAYKRAAKPGTLSKWVLEQLDRSAGYEPKK